MYSAILFIVNGKVTFYNDIERILSQNVAPKNVQVPGVPPGVSRGGFVTTVAGGGDET